MTISWYPLAGADPVPGEPWVVTQGAEHYAAVATAIKSASANLASIVNLDGMSSEAVKEIRERAATVGEEIATVERRYADVGAALSAYAGALTTAQLDAADLRRRAQLAQQRIDDADTAHYRADAALDQAAPEDQSARQTDVISARAESHLAGAALALLRTELDVVTRARDEAADTAIAAIDGVVGSDDLNDGWWDNWGSKVANVVSDVAGTIAAVAGIAALVLAWVPILGQALAAVALIAGAVKLIADFALVAHGEGSWTEVILGIVGLATFGIGRVAGAVFKASSRASTGIARLRAGQLAARAGNSRVALNGLAGPVLGQLSRGAARTLARPVTGASSILRPAVTGSKLDLLGDLKGGWRMLTDRAFASQQWSAGRATFDGVTDVKSWLLTQQGHGAAASSLTQLAGVSPEVMSSAPNMARAVAATNWSGATLGILAADGLRGAVDGAGGLVTMVTDAFGPSTAQELNLGPR